MSHTCKHFLILDTCCEQEKFITESLLIRKEKNCSPACSSLPLVCLTCLFSRHYLHLDSLLHTARANRWQLTTVTHGARLDMGTELQKSGPSSRKKKELIKPQHKIGRKPSGSSNLISYYSHFPWKRQQPVTRSVWKPECALRELVLSGFTLA